MVTVEDEGGQGLTEELMSLLRKLKNCSVAHGVLEPESLKISGILRQNKKMAYVILIHFYPLSAISEILALRCVCSVTASRRIDHHHLIADQHFRDDLVTINESFAGIAEV